MGLVGKKILVTGGAGYIGSNLCKALSKQNVVTSLDNYFTGRLENHINGVEYINGNTCEIDILIAPDRNFDLIFHLGEYSRVEQSFSDFEIVCQSNVRGTLEVIKYAAKKNSKIIYAGSSTKFGDGGMTASSSPYSWSKAANTKLVTNYADWYGLNHAIVYFYNAYGSNEIRTGKYATLIGIYSENMKNGEPLGVVAPGTQMRNFTHVNDIVSGLIAVGASGSGDNYGIGASESYSIEDIARLFGGETVMLPERKGNRMTADVITQKTRALGWNPEVRLTDYITRLAANSFEYTE